MTITVWTACDGDGCERETEVTLQSQGDYWSDPHFRAALKQRGWKLNGRGFALCPDCVEQAIAGQAKEGTPS